MRETTAIGAIAVFQLIMGLGMGLLYSTTVSTRNHFAYSGVHILLSNLIVCSPGSSWIIAKCCCCIFVNVLPCIFPRKFLCLHQVSALNISPQAWGVAIGGAILQNELYTNLPPSAVFQPNDGGQISYTLIPLIPTMPEPLRAQVKHAFYESLRPVWIAMEALCGLGFLSFIAMKDIPLRKTVDKKWGVQGAEKNREAPDPISPRGDLHSSPHIDAIDRASVANQGWVARNNLYFYVSSWWIGQVCVWIRRV